MSKRNLHDLVLAARINWECPWKDTPAAAKATFFEVVSYFRTFTWILPTFPIQARERHPYLAEFQNDWATEELAKQYIKNKRNNAYKKKYIPVPPQYGYLKANAAKRNPSAQRGRKAKLRKVDAAAKKTLKTSTSTRTATKSGKSSNEASAKSKGKRRAVVDASDDDDGMSSAGGGQGADDEEWEE